MSIAKCPKCHDEVVVPPYTKRDLRVQCPLCQEQYVLGDVLDKLPPALILLDAPPMEMALAAAPAPSLAATDELAIEGEPAAAPAGPFTFEEAPAPQRPSPAPRMKPVSRPKKKKSNPLFELVKVSMGGLAGVVLAFVIMWWNPIKRVDPFELGPTVAKYARWVVPEQFRAGKTTQNGDGSEVKNGQPTGPAVAANTPADKPQKNNGKGPKKPKQEPVELELPAAVADEFTPAPTIDEPKINLPTLDLPGSDPFGVKAVKPPVGKPPVTLPDEAPETTDEPKPLDLPAKPVVPPVPPTEDTLRKAMNEFSRAVGDWGDADDNPAADRPKLAQSLHRTLVRLADELDKPIEEMARMELQIVLSGVVENEKVVKPIQAGARFWLQSKTRTSDGIGMLGVVRKTAPAGTWFTTEVEIGTAAGVPVIATILSKDDPANTSPEGSTVMVLGKIIDDPKSLGFQGEAATVILGTMFATKNAKSE